MKKFSAILICIIILISFAGCGQSQEDGAPVQNGTAESVQLGAAGNEENDDVSVPEDDMTGPQGSSEEAPDSGNETQPEPDETQQEPEDNISLDFHPDFRTAWANYSDIYSIAEKSLNWDIILHPELNTVTVMHLPVFRFDSTSDISAFKDGFQSVLTFDAGYNEIPSFDEAVSDYDDEFFSENSLLCVYVDSFSGSFRFGINDIVNDGKSLRINVVQTNSPETYTADMAGWFLIVETAKSDIAGCTEFDACDGGRYVIYD